VTENNRYCGALEFIPKDITITLLQNRDKKEFLRIFYYQVCLKTHNLSKETHLYYLSVFFNVLTNVI